MFIDTCGVHAYIYVCSVWGRVVGGTAVERVRVKWVNRPVDARIFFSVPRAGTDLPRLCRGSPR